MPDCTKCLKQGLLATARFRTVISPVRSSGID
jgi:hypothetical protein